MSCCTEIDDEPVEFLCPTLYIAQKWLRENKNFISLYIIVLLVTHTIYLKQMGTVVFCFPKGPNDGGNWDAYEEALEAGIQETFKTYMIRESKPNIFFLAIFIISALFIGHFRLTFSPFMYPFPIGIGL